MATVVDAFLVSLGLDPKGWSAGLRSAGSDLTKFRKESEGATKQVTEGFSKLRNEVISFFAIFTAGKGLKDFIQDTTRVNAELGRLAFSLGETTQRMSLWRGAGQLVGSSAEDMSASVSGLTQELQNFALTGQSTLLPWLRVMQGAVGHGFDLIDEKTHKLKSATDLLKYAAEYADHEPDKARAGQVLRNLGLSQGMINLVLQGSAALNKYLEISASLGVVTKHDTDAAAALQESMAELDISSNSVGRTLLTAVTPALIWVGNALTAVNKFLLNHPALLNSIAVGLGVVAAALSVVTTGMIAMGAAGVLAWLGITAPIGLFIGLIAGASVVIGLFLDDIKTWSDGGKSAFGGFYQIVSNTLNGIQKLWAKVWPNLKADIKGIIPYLNLLAPITGVYIPTDIKDEQAGKSNGGGAGPRGGRSDALASLIGSGEGGYSSVNLGKAGGYKSSTRDLSSMTIAEVMAAQASGEFNAAGRYQIIKKTLAQAVSAMHLSGDTKFNAATQDKIFKDYLIGSKNPAIGNYLSGKSNDIKAAAKAAAAEWASLADPDTGRSAYDGIAGNKASISSDRVMQALRQSRNSAPNTIPAGISVAAGGFPAGARLGGGGNATHIETSIANINVVTQAKDAAGIAASIGPALSDVFANQANSGPQG